MTRGYNGEVCVRGVGVGVGGGKVERKRSSLCLDQGSNPLLELLLLGHSAARQTTGPRPPCFNILTFLTHVLSCAPAMAVAGDVRVAGRVTLH